ncbi:DUF2141 domain-containing protein [Brevundimonas sp. SORGH_AS_0993]|uniref:DUF2141 domain-containing protein n=1 Tax=Brevundimonas sp. SORGH_AS_0993 TaxID=3041794 RepID=UPI00278AE15F|nr:DUF2141 domain-containing protein [Brevundimonas sp. SORGH_AS_0993]MDQ1155051.1 uncharacterized protein (DUF2141 family) [Brevundimonas sp. SORGH_AS_0993]
MNLKSKSVLIAATAALAALMGGGAALAGDVTITVTGVQARGGDLLVGLQTASQFLKHEGSYGQIIAAPTAGTHVVTLRDVAPGDYSVSVLHDVDGDRQMKMANGRPAEGWAMVNGAALRAAPRFDRVKFTVPAAGVAAVSVAMQYPPAS